MITAEAIQKSHSVHCPCCNAILNVVGRHEQTIPDDQEWLTDGDTVDGIWDALSDPQKVPSAFSYELMMGCCAICGQSHYAVTASFMNANYEQSGVESCLSFWGPYDGQRNYICYGTKPLTDTWLLMVFETSLGPMFHHTFGPFLLKAS